MVPLRILPILLTFVVAGCTPTQHMGDPISAQTEAQRSKGEAPPKAEQQTDAWEATWQAIQGPSDTVKWTDHMQVCGLKYRFRNYDQLFRCLDLLEAKIAAGGERVPKADLVQRGAPVMIGWLRASAYSELGEPEIALKHAEAAWSALPEAFRAADSAITVQGTFGGVRDDLASVYWVAGSLGSSGLGIESADIDQGMMRGGRNNAAALDFRPPNVTMALAVQRSLLYLRVGELQKSDAALEDLARWQKTEWKGGGFSLIPSHLKPFGARAQLLSIGPLFARGEYDHVVYYYEALVKSFAKVRAKERRSQILGIFDMSLLSGAIVSAMGPDDARAFAIAVEDVSNALIYAQSLVRVGRTADARNMLDTLLAKDEIRAMGNLYWATLYERGSIALRESKADEGIRFLTQSVDAIESVRSTISFEAAKIGFAGDKQTVYVALVDAFAHAGDWRNAFLYAERAKARALVDLLAQRQDLSAPDASNQRVQDLLAHAETADTSLGVASTTDSVRGIKVVGDARRALSTEAPEAASLISVQQINLDAIAARLDADETLIDYYGHGDDMYVFLMRGGAITGVALSANGLDDDVRAFRSSIDRRDPDSAEVGQRLYERLIAPLLAELPGRKLTIAPHGALHYLPFAALSDADGNYLLDRFSIRLVPSASTLIYLRTEPRTKAGKLLAFGNPDLGDRALDLPNAQTEATVVAAMFPQSQALVRSEASKSAAKALAGGFSMLHFATHGRFDAEAPLSSGLYLAKGTEPDGLLSVGDLYSLRWDADLVTLSACETGLGKVASGDDVIGLTRGFLYAGARSIVASLWEVDDAATAQLMEAFYGNLAGSDKREALRLAQIRTREKYPPPWYWAAFNVLGRAD